MPLPREEPLALDRVTFAQADASKWALGLRAATLEKKNMAFSHTMLHDASDAVSCRLRVASGGITIDYVRAPIPILHFRLSPGSKHPSFIWA